MLPVVSGVFFFKVAYCAMSDTTLETCEIPIVKKNQTASSHCHYDLLTQLIIKLKTNKTQIVCSSYVLVSL